MDEFVKPTVPTVDVAPTESERSRSMAIHLCGLLAFVIAPVAIVIPLVLWLTKKDESAYINDHGREAMNYNLSIWLYAVISTILMLVCVGYFLLAGLVVFDIVIMIVAAVQANGGHYFRYPITIRFVPS